MDAHRATKARVVSRSLAVLHHLPGRFNPTIRFELTARCPAVQQKLRHKVMARHYRTLLSSALRGGRQMRGPEVIRRARPGVGPSGQASTSAAHPKGTEGHSGTLRGNCRQWATPTSAARRTQHPATSSRWWRGRLPKCPSRSVALRSPRRGNN